MRNHFHLVVETPNANRVDGMHWLLSTYTIRLNRRHETPGHVFSGRYKALVVESDEGGYLKTVCDCVRLNPVRAHLLGTQDRLLSSSAQEHSGPSGVGNLQGSQQKLARLDATD